jgi:hypothetical protein
MSMYQLNIQRMLWKDLAERKKCMRLVERSRCPLWGQWQGDYAQVSDVEHNSDVAVNTG